MTETGAEAALPEELTSFETFCPDIQRAVAEMGWTGPMPVQKRVTPVMRRGRDLIAQAMTGSGKTGAFGLPSLEIIDPGSARAAGARAYARARAADRERDQAHGQVPGHRDGLGLRRHAYGPQLEAFAAARR
jgi:superfamily II DNA/RNA helicase